MSLRRAQVGDRPQGAVRLSKEEAISFQTNRVESWKNQSEVWFLNNGGSVLAAATAVSSFAILNFFRYKLRLGNTARFSTYLPTVLVPATGSFLIHEFSIKNKILIQEICPVCVEIRSILSQLGFGVLQPTIMSMLMSFGLAQQSYTYPVPEFKPSNPTKFYRFTGKLFRDGRTYFVGAILLHLFTASLVVYKQYSEMERVNKYDTEEEFSEFS